MTARGAIVAVRARVKAALPLAADRSGDPHPVAEGDLPAFRVSLTLDQAAPVAMGDTARRATGTLSVAAMVRARPDFDMAPALQSLADVIEAAILAPPARLAGQVRTLDPAARDDEQAQGGERLAQISVSFSVVIDGPDLLATPPAGLGLA